MLSSGGMGRVLVYTLLLIAGMVIALGVPLDPIRPTISILSIICLAYIMIEVGLEFTLAKEHLWSYGKDFLIAATTAVLPWILVSLYFMWALGTPTLDAWIIGHFAAPTSAGILFTMLAAAGLGTSWLFEKARVLAIFDNIDTVLIMSFLQVTGVGVGWSLLVSIPVILILLWLAYHFLHRLRWSTKPVALFLYGVVIVVILEAIQHTINVQVEVILPAFVLGCVLFNPHDPYQPRKHHHEHAYIEPEGRTGAWIFDAIVKGAFMFLVGLSLPPAHFSHTAWWIIGANVIAIAFLSNLGKSSPALFYKKEASFKERIALSLSMYPRGEVGAGVLLIIVDYGLEREAIAYAEASLALNLLLTGLFVWAAIKLIPRGPMVA